MRRTRFLAAAAALLAPRVAGAQTLTPVRVGTVPTESFGLPFFAQEGGFFKKHGIDAQLTYFRGGGAVLTGLVGGSLDVACVNWGATANAHMHAVPVQVIAAGGIYTSEAPTTILAVGKDSTIRTAADLNGKTVGLSTLADLQQAAVMKWVDENGGNSASVKFVELSIPQIPPALNANRLDAGIVLEPILTAQAGQIRILAPVYDTIAKKLMISAELGMADYLNRNPATTHAVIDALHETANWANANHDAAGQILERVSKISLATISTMHRTLFSDQLPLAMIQPVIDASAAYHFFPRTFPAQEMFWPGLRK